MSTSNATLQSWVEQVARLTKPDSIHWCTGSDAENSTLIEAMLRSGDLIKLNQATHPNCYLHRSSPSDVARVEHLTFVCTRNREDAGPNNHWMDPAEAHAKIDALFDGCMRGRTLYVVPYCMGPIDSPYARCGVEITDSAYVVVNMRIMTRMGTPALERIERDGTFVKGLHSIGELDPDRRFIMHFPEELAIESFGSGYGGNALLGKKCHALRIASWQARDEGWLAEHMLIVGVQNPEGRDALHRRRVPVGLRQDQSRDADSARLDAGLEDLDRRRRHLPGCIPAPDGRLCAINPEAGYFGVVPGTNRKTNRNAFDMIQRDTIFTNVALTADNQPWWEGLDSGTPVIDWQGKPYDPGSGPAAHPNSRFTVSAKQNPIYSTLADAPEGVPISAILFGGRRREVAPLVYEARNWQHGVLVGASAWPPKRPPRPSARWASCAATPMAMKPFCGYNFGDYWKHWLSFEGQRRASCRASSTSTGSAATRTASFLWPGYGENLRVLRWITDRCDGKVEAQDTPIGFVPRRQDLDVSGPEHRRRDARDAAVGRPGRVAPRGRDPSASTWTSSASACRRSCAKSCGTCEKRLSG